MKLKTHVTGTFFLLFIFFSISPSAAFYLEKTIDGHETDINDMFFQKSDFSIVTSSEKPRITLWNYETGEIIKSWVEDNNPVSNVIIHGKRICYIKWENKYIYILSTDDNSLLKMEVESEPTILSLSDNGKTLISGHTDGSIIFWDFDTLEKMEKYQITDNPIINTVFTSDNDQLIISDNSDAGLLYFFDIKKRKIAYELSAHNKMISSLSVSQDGNLLASGSIDKTVKIWDIKSKKLLKVFNGHTEEIVSISFSMDGSLLASSSYDNTLRIWNTIEASQISLIKGTNTIKKIIFISDDEVLGASGKQLKVWNASSGKIVREFGLPKLPELLANKISTENNGFSVHSFCKLDLDGDNRPDYSVTLIKENEIKYIVSINNRTETIVQVKHTAPESNCFSSDELKELIDSIKIMEEVNCNIKVINNYDTVCTFVNETESKCWQYDSNTKKMIHTGGWRID
jgi:WD40 repeat protein